VHTVKVIGGGTELDEGRDGKKLLRIRITAEVDGVRSEYTITTAGAEPTTQPWVTPRRGPAPPTAERQTPRDSPP
jgi:hypothetical protein